MAAPAVMAKCPLGPRYGEFRVRLKGFTILRTNDLVVAIDHSLLNAHRPSIEESFAGGRWIEIKAPGVAPDKKLLDRIKN